MKSPAKPHNSKCICLIYILKDSLKIDFSFSGIHFRAFLLSIIFKFFNKQSRSWTLIQHVLKHLKGHSVMIRVLWSLFHRYSLSLLNMTYLKSQFKTYYKIAVKRVESPNFSSKFRETLLIQHKNIPESKKASVTLL